MEVKELKDPRTWDWSEMANVARQSLEYLVRLWSAPEEPRFRKPILGRLRWMGTPMALIDLAAILPFYIPLAVTVDLRLEFEL